MDILSLHNLLIALGFQGLLWTFLLILLCFGGVYVVGLARLGWEYKTEQAKTPAPPPKSIEKTKEEKKAPAEKSQEPIYYIVEKKKRRPKTDYGEPKPFQFKEN